MNEYRFDEIFVGLEHKFSAEITNRMMEQFLEISGDCNPLHLNADYAVANGFKDKVVYGMLTASFYSTLAGVYLPGKYCLLHSVNVQFSKPVFVSDELTITGKVSRINEAFKQLEIKAKIHNQSDTCVSKALLKAGFLNER